MDKDLKEIYDWLTQDDYAIKNKKSALKGFVWTFRIEGRSKIDARTFMKNAKNNVVRLLDEKEKPYKMKLILEVLFSKKKSKNVPYFHSEIEVITDGTDLAKVYKRMQEDILEKVDTFQNMGSGWIFRRVVALDINTDKYMPIRGRSYIDLPLKLKKKNAIINVENKDNQCFKWATTVAIFTPEKHPERITKVLKENAKKLDWNGLEFPVQLDKISIFEKNNPKYAVNVYGWKESVYPLRISDNEDREQTINLLLISNHYCWIKSMSRLLSAQITKHGHKRYFCERCLVSFKTEISLSKHSEYCGKHNSIKITMPKKGSAITFKNYNRSMRVPFVVYADFECFTEPIDNSSEHTEDSPFTEKYQKHKPSGYCYAIKSSDDLFKPKIVRYTAKEDEDIGKLFVESLEKDVRKLAKIKTKLIIMTKENQEDYDMATHCFICGKKLNEDKVRDHNHLTGEYRGAAHNDCNLNYRIPKHIPVIFHNLAGYDAHLFVKSLGFSEGKIDCIPNNEEKYISFKKNIIVDSFVKDGKTILIKRELRFIDSFKFMGFGLDKLVSNLKKEQFRNMAEFFAGEELDLMLRKGVYPYDYVNCLAKLDETCLPKKEEFLSKLNDSNISDADYIHAKKVWKVFKMSSMKDYHDLYLLSDVLLLMDVFETFRDVCIDNYKLDPAWYYTAPGLSWDAMLKMTDIKLELLTDVDMLLMIENGTRGGVSVITKRHAKANNKYMDNKFQPYKRSKFIKYLDANNLYGWAMSNALPTSDFKWMSKDKLNKWRKHPCILEVDLEYPEELKELHDEYPLAPEHIVLSKVEKLVPTTRDKVKYVVHHEALKTYESLGLKVKKIHKGIMFNESAWLKKYIDLNTQLRTAAKNDFEKDFFKLMNNSVFGKTMENIRNRQDIKLVSTAEQAAKLIAQPNFHRRTIFSEHLVAIHMRKTELIFNKPVYLGMSILDLSKTLMYDFHYNYVKKKYASDARLLFTDTDSLMYEIKTDDFYADIEKDIDEWFDTSAYSKDHSGIKKWTNKKVIGMFKDETAAEGEITEFVGLRAKLYSYRTMDKEEKKCKGIKKSVVKNDLEFEDYKNCLLSGEKVYRKMNVIRSYKHQIFSETVNKVALSREDDKRIIHEDGIHTSSL